MNLSNSENKYILHQSILQETLDYIAQALPTTFAFPSGRVHNLILALQGLKVLSDVVTAPGEVPNGSPVEVNQQ